VGSKVSQEDGVKSSEIKEISIILVAREVGKIGASLCLTEWPPHLYQPLLQKFSTFILSDASPQCAPGIGVPATDIGDVVVYTVFNSVS
jgi:hypothetical protein